MTTSACARTLVCAAALAGAGLLAGCGGDDESALASEGSPATPPRATATFASSQRLASTRALRITVVNRDAKAIPSVAVQLKGLDRRLEVGEGTAQPADPRRPVWTVDQAPDGLATQNTDTWQLGALAAGARRTYVWRLTPIVSGDHALRWRVVAGAAGGPRGSFSVTVAD